MKEMGEMGEPLGTGGANGFGGLLRGDEGIVNGRVGIE